MTHHQRLTVDDKLRVHTDLDLLKGKCAFMGEGEYVLILEKVNSNKTTAEWLKEYGAKRDIIVMESGYKRKDIDDMVNEDILQVLFEDERNIIDTVFSKKSLSPLGWKMLFFNLRIWAFDRFNVYI